MAKHHDWARALYDQTAAIAFDLGSPRAEAFAMLGAAAMLDISPDHAIARRTLAQFGDGFLALLGSARRPEWPWFEIVLRTEERGVGQEGVRTCRSRWERST